jgi:hypothetical protein
MRHPTNRLAVGLLDRPYGAAVAALFLTAAIIYFTGGDVASRGIASALGDQDWLVPVWNACWLVGGTLMLAGILLMDRRIELPGVIGVTTGLALATYANIHIAGWEWGFITLIGLVVAGAIRIGVIVTRVEHRGRVG